MALSFDSSHESDASSDTQRASLAPLATRTTFSSLNDATGSHLNVALQRLSLANRPASEFDNFYTPENANFYAQKPYFKLDHTRHEIRLLKVYPEMKTYSQHIKDHPEWKGRDSAMSQDTNSILYRSQITLPRQQKGRSGSQTMRSPRKSEPEEDVIACELLDKVPLSRVDGRYHALSYCAGSPKNVSKILINGIMFNAFANLEHAIQCALISWKSRSPDTELLLWADQICINQEDLVERSSQVGMMRDTYLRSQDAIICISTYIPDPTRRRREHKEPIIGGEYWMLYGPSFRNPTPFDDIDLFVRRQLKSKFPILEELPMCFESLCVFLSSPWWSRAWVFQEFIMAPRAYFVHGERTVSWADLSTVLEGVFNLGEEQLKDLENNISKLIKESETEEENQERLENEEIAQEEKEWNAKHRDSILRQIQKLESERSALVHLKVEAYESAEKRIKWSKSDRKLAKQFASSSREIDIIDRQVETLGLNLKKPDIGKMPRTTGSKIRQYHLDALHKEQEALRIAQVSIARVLQLLPKLRSCLGPVVSFMKGKARQKKVFGLKELLQHSRECRASDPRDKIYAFLGLADQGYGIIPKYTWQNTIVHVLIHTAQRIIAFEGNLHILEHVGEGREKLGTLLPSWVPDVSMNAFIWYHTAPKESLCSLFLLVHE
jgi:hypothetical protein